MNTRALPILLVAGGVVISAGTGAYIATRHSQSNPVAQETPAAQQVAPSQAPEGGVTETEGVLIPDPAAEQALAPEPVQAKAQAAAQPPTASRPAPRTTASAPSANARETRGRGETALPARSRETINRESPADPSHDAQVRPGPSAQAPASPGASPWPGPAPTAEPEREQTPPPPPAPRFEEVVVPADSVVGLQIDNGVSSETAKIEDRVDARVTRDVRSAGVVAIPAGTRVQGSVTLVDRGGKMKERARLGVRFHTLVLADGSRVPIQTETVFREGDSPTKESAAKIGGGAVGGAIIGAILGGGKGAAIGAGVGAGAGTAATMAGGRNPATLTAGSTVTVRLSSPATITVEKE